MKKSLITIVIAFLFVSCSFKEMDKLVYYSSWDFSYYSMQGFLFTPESYLFDYESIGLIRVSIFPEVKFNKDAVSDYDKKYAQGEIETAEVIDSMYYMAKDMGANAIINFKVEDISYVNGPMIVKGKLAQGFAIKRKNR